MDASADFRRQLAAKLRQVPSDHNTYPVVGDKHAPVPGLTTDYSNNDNLPYADGTNSTPSETVVANPSDNHNLNITSSLPRMVRATTSLPSPNTNHNHDPNTNTNPSENPVQYQTQNSPPPLVAESNSNKSMRYRLSQSIKKSGITSSSQKKSSSIGNKAKQWLMGEDHGSGGNSNSSGSSSSNSNGGGGNGTNHPSTEDHVHRLEHLSSVSEPCAFCDYDMNPLVSEARQCQNCDLYVHGSCMKQLKRLGKRGDDVALQSLCCNGTRNTRKMYIFTKWSFYLLKLRFEMEFRDPGLQDNGYIGCLKNMIEHCTTQYRSSHSRQQSYDDVSLIMSRYMASYYKRSNIDIEEYDFLPERVFRLLKGCMEDETFYFECSLSGEDTVFLSGVDMAEQMTLLDHEYYNMLSEDEFLDGKFHKKNKKELSPNICAFTSNFNRLTKYVISEVVSQLNTKLRADTICFFVCMAYRLRELRNFHSLKAVVSGLLATPVYRLKKTWAYVPGSVKHNLDKLVDLMTEQDNYRNYRECYDVCMDNKHSGIPFLGVGLGDIVYLETAFGSADQKPLLRKKIDDITTSILQYQNKSYPNLHPIFGLEYYIMDLKYATEDECYKLSLLREPKEDKRSATAPSSTLVASLDRHNNKNSQSSTSVNAAASAAIPQSTKNLLFNVNDLGSTISNANGINSSNSSSSVRTSNTDMGSSSAYHNNNNNNSFNTRRKPKPSPAPTMPIPPAHMLKQASYYNKTNNVSNSDLLPNNNNTSPDMVSGGGASSNPRPPSLPPKPKVGSSHITISQPIPILHVEPKGLYGKISGDGGESQNKGEEYSAKQRRRGHLRAKSDGSLDNLSNLNEMNKHYSSNNNGYNKWGVTSDEGTNLIEDNTISVDTTVQKYKSESDSSYSNNVPPQQMQRLGKGRPKSSPGHCKVNNRISQNNSKDRYSELDSSSNRLEDLSFNNFSLGNESTNINMNEQDNVDDNVDANSDIHDNESYNGPPNLSSVLETLGNIQGITDRLQQRQDTISLALDEKDTSSNRDHATHHDLKALIGLNGRDIKKLGLTLKKMEIKLRRDFK